MIYYAYQVSYNLRWPQGSDSSLGVQAGCGNHEIIGAATIEWTDGLGGETWREAPQVASLSII